MSFGGNRGLYYVDCDVGHVRSADIATVGALARAALNAQRAGERLRIVDASDALQELIELAGLGEVLLWRRRREPEQREQPRRVEERREADDPPG
jgi:anti-anti-sigma regulatory factor